MLHNLYMNLKLLYFSESLDINFDDRNFFIFERLKERVCLINKCYKNNTRDK